MLGSIPDIESIPLPDDHFAIYVNKEDAAIIEAEGLSYLNKLTNLIESSAEGPFLTPRVFAIQDALGLKRNNVGYQSSSATILVAIQAGLGFSLLPTQMNFGLLPDNIVKIPLDCPEAVIGQALGWHHGSRNIAVKNFVDIVSKQNNEP